MIRRVKRVKPKKRFTPVKVVDPVKTGDQREFLFLPPLEPKRKLLIGASVVLAIWVAVLVVMYITTVYPQRHGKVRPLTTQPAVPASQPAVPVNT